MTAVPDLEVRAFELADRDWAIPLLDREFGGQFQARRGELIDVLDGPALVAESDDGVAGLLCYGIDDDECELRLLLALERGSGVGSVLVHALRQRLIGCKRVWVVTTNDNVDALAFYQRRGFRLSEVRIGAVDHTRRMLKPQISLAGEHGIPIRDELELELIL